MRKQEGGIRMKRYGLIITIAFLWIFGLTFSIWATEFSADMLQTFKGKTENGKIYVKGKMIRMDMTKKGEERIIILDMNKKISYVLMPKDKIYIETTVGGEMSAATANIDVQETQGTWKELGTETINGYLCDKRLFIYKDKSKGELTQWMAKKLTYPIKSYYKSKEGEMTTEYKNIKEGGVPDSLFKIPAGYTKMNMPSMGGKGMIPGMGKIPTPPAGQDSGEDDD